MNWRMFAPLLALALPALAQIEGLAPVDRPPAELIDTVKRDSTHEPIPLADDLSLLPFGDGKPAKGVKDLEKLAYAAVLHEGRLKPFETFARHHLLQLSGRRTYEKRSAVETMAYLLFAPESTVNWKIFQIDNPEVAQGMGIPEEKKRRYSLKQLQKGLHKLQKLAEAANKVEEPKRSLTDKEFLRVWSNVFLLVQLGHSFDFAMPSNPFTLRMPESRHLLGLQADRERFSFWELMARAPALAQVLESVGDRAPDERSGVETEIIAVSQAMFLASQSSQPSALKVIPPPAGEGEEWISPPEAVARPEHLQRDHALLDHWVKAMMAYRNGNQAAFDSALTAAQALVADRDQARISKTRFQLEVPYQRFDGHSKALILYWIALIGCFLFFMRQNKWLYYSLVSMVSIALLINVAAIIARILIMRRPPVTSLYETFPFVAAVAVLAALVIELFNRRGIGLLSASMLGVGLLSIANRYAAEGDTMRMLVAVLDSNFWLSTHVITITIGYSACLLCGAIGHVWLVGALLPGKEDKPQRLREIQKMLYGTLGFGLIFSFIGTVLGGIWADQSWGRFWGWDPKENGALLIVIWCVILLHARWWGKIRDLGMALGVVFGAIVVSIAWLGVNLLNVGLHSYGFTSGTAYKLMAYIYAELLFMLITGVWIKMKQRKERALAAPASSP
jgi:ABC-type transport system involved in cytochrome c biogenesis permease subunit